MIDPLAEIVKSPLLDLVLVHPCPVTFSKKMEIGFANRAKTSIFNIEINATVVKKKKLILRKIKELVKNTPKIGSVKNAKMLILQEEFNVMCVRVKEKM